MTYSLESAFHRARAYVEKMPSAIQGSHGDNQTLAVANLLVWDFALDESKALVILREYNSRCIPPWSESELIRKLRSAERQPHAKPRGNMLDSFRSKMVSTVQPTPRVRIDPTNAVENYLRGFQCAEADLIAASTCRIPPLICGRNFHHQAAYLIDQLFEPGELVNVVTSAIVSDGKARPGDSGATLERNEWQRRILSWTGPLQEPGAWLRMNPLNGSGVTDANITAFRFALIEFDGLPVELQLPLLARLPLPVAVVLKTAGRSIHAWVRLDAKTADEYRNTISRMLAVLAPLGVDPKNKNPSRLSRLPGAIRTVGAIGDGQQRLLFLNPQPEEQKAIL